jgi:gluconate 5-dehydrogenase
MGSGGNELNVIAYTAAKGGLRNLTQQLGCEWADRGVRVNAISPGFVVTEMIRPAIEGGGIGDYIASRTPMRRLCEVQELIGPLLFLASDASSYVTGLDLLVDGGTNAANGYYQIEPGHHFWNNQVPKHGRQYAGVQDMPEEMAVWKLGVPGIHFPMPSEPA